MACLFLPGFPVPPTLPSSPSTQLPAATEAQQTGFNIKRGEFEPEWDAEAEAIIAELADFGWAGLWGLGTNSVMGVSQLDMAFGGLAK
jgi:hypothetical protein